MCLKNLALVWFLGLQKWRELLEKSWWYDRPIFTHFGVESFQPIRHISLFDGWEYQFTSRHSRWSGNNYWSNTPSFRFLFRLLDLIRSTRSVIVYFWFYLIFILFTFRCGKWKKLSGLKLNGRIGYCLESLLDNRGTKKKQKRNSTIRWVWSTFHTSSTHCALLAPFIHCSTLLTEGMLIMYIFIIFKYYENTTFQLS